MFLTKKGFLKALIMSIYCFALGTGCIVFSFILTTTDSPDNTLLLLSILSYFLCFFTYFWGRYSEGKSKLIILGTRLVRNELRPIEFIKHYESLKTSKDLVVNKPSIEVLQLVAIAYDLLDDREKVLATADEMISLADDKKKVRGMLIKSSYLYIYDRIDEAEILFNEARSRKLDIVSNSLIDSILKSDRAIAMGDYKTAEAYALMLLDRSFPKLDNLGKLVVHYELGKIYEILQDNEKAFSHYRYCMDFGGDTAIMRRAIEKLQYLK